MQAGGLVQEKSTLISTVKSCQCVFYQSRFKREGSGAKYDCCLL